jgi:phosphoglycerate dehydrogenase-like enzyme
MMTRHWRSAFVKEQGFVQVALGREIDEARVAEMQEMFPGVTFASVTQDPDGIREADAFIGRIPAEVYAKAGPNLRWVHSTGAGIETIVAIPELVASEIVVTNTRGAHAPFVAEHAFALLLALGRNLAGFAYDQRDHVYRSYGRDIPMDSLYGKTMLILGMGNIGRAIARRALAFDMQVVGLDLMAPEESTGDLTVLPMEHLDAELGSADVVMVAVPYTPETDNLLNADRIAALKPGAMVIGISRGHIVNEEALAARLRDGTLAGAGLDVFAEEPLPADHFLWDTPHLVMTPHCAPKSPVTRNREYEITFENIRRFVAGEPLLNVCDKVAGF